MTFPSGTVISTDNLSSSSANPNLARVDLLSLVQAFNQLIASQNSASGVLVLNSSGKISATYMPGTFTSAGDIVFQPSSGIVSISRVLRMSEVWTTDLGTAAVGTEAPSAGDIVYLKDGDAGQPCLGCYDGSHWRVVRFMTQVGDVGAALTSTTTLAVEAD